MVESKHQWKAWLYLSPAIILLLVFTVWPIINTLIMAFSNGYSTMGQIGGSVYEPGFENFIKVIDYPRFQQCLKNTILLCVTTVPISTVLALLIAVCLNSIKPLQRVLQTIFFLPTPSIIRFSMVQSVSNTLCSFLLLVNQMMLLV